MTDPSNFRQRARARAFRLHLPGGFFGRLFAVLLALVGLFLLFAFTLVFLAIGLIGGIAFWLYRRFFAPKRPAPARGFDEGASGQIIEGELVRDETPTPTPPSRRIE